MQAGIFFTTSLFLLRETNAAVLLQKKTLRLRKETGNAVLVSKMDRGLTPRQLFLRAIVRPTKLLVLSPIVLLVRNQMIQARPMSRVFAKVSFLRPALTPLRLRLRPPLPPLHNLSTGLRRTIRLLRRRVRLIISRSRHRDVLLVGSLREFLGQAVQSDS